MLKYAYASLVMRTIIFVLTTVRYNPSAYNIDLSSAKVFHDPACKPKITDKRGSYFGFSVALYVGANESVLLVGAPRANSSELQSVTEPGTVFQCKMNGRCAEWPIDKTGNGPHPREKLNQIKDNAWIGAAIAVQNKVEARVVVCGPRWMSDITRGNKSRWYTNGICYTTLAISANAFEREAEERLLPFSNPDNQTASKNNIVFYNYGQAQTGFSLHMNSRYTVDVAMGSPGVYGWKGHAILTTQVNGPRLHTVIPSLAGEIYSYNYFGYAITAGSYFNERNIWYASSAPRGANMYGLILVFNFPLESNQNMFVTTSVYGRQYGEYFGAALTSCDVNNDRRHELIVGAPQWSRDMDEGRVYIFTTRYNDFWNFVKLQTIEGEIVGGRFGSAVMCLGDIDYDGYGDIAVGAPYEEESGGAVYIFNGNRDGVSRKYSQRLVGSRFSPTMRGFGISISEPRDVNRDSHSNIAVGAYQSGEVVLLKSVTVVTLNVTFVSKLKLLKNVTCFKVDIWVSYKGIPDCLQVSVTLKIDHRAKYMEYESNDGSHRWSYTLPKMRTVIISPEIHLKKDIQNMISPLEISASLQLDNAKNGNCCTSCAVNKLRSKTEDVIKLPFVNFKDHVCTSDLGVTLSTDSSPSNRYIIGSTPIIMLYVNVYNRGEPAYQAKVRIFTEILMLASIPPECIEDSHINSTLDVICDVDDPLRTNKTLTLQLDMSMVRYVKEIKLQAHISTQNNETNLDDNTHVITMYFDMDVNLMIVGKARESLYSYLRTSEERTLNDIRFQHVYEVQNFGVTPVEEAVLTVKIPTHIWRPDTGEIAIVNINNITGRMNGYELYCGDSRQTEFSFALKKIVSTHKNSSSIMNHNTHAKFGINVPSENRTLYINCTSSMVHCVQFDCRLQPFLSSLSVAKFLVTLDLQRSNFLDDMMKDKDIIFYVTEGSINITQSYVIQRDGHKSDTILVATTFLDSPIVQQISAWLIAFSVFLGIVLLTLLILCLIKVGFFKRERIDLEALKIETDLCIKVV